VDVPGAAGGTKVDGVNDHGVLAGTYFDQGHQNKPHGFIKDGSQLVRFDYPGTSAVTTVASLNNPGTVIGSYTDSNGAYHGWIRSASGSFSPIDHPLAGSANRFRCALRAPGDENGVSTWPADVGWPWLRETVQQIDAGVPSFGCPPVASRTRVSVS
jgi:hypothetical protein